GPQRWGKVEGNTGETMGQHGFNVWGNVVPGVPPRAPCPVPQFPPFPLSLSPSLLLSFLVYIKNKRVRKVNWQTEDLGDGWTLVPDTGDRPTWPEQRWPQC